MYELIGRIVVGIFIYWFIAGTMVVLYSIISKEIGRTIDENDKLKFSFDRVFPDIGMYYLLGFLIVPAVIIDKIKVILSMFKLKRKSYCMNCKHVKMLGGNYVCHFKPVGMSGCLAEMRLHYNKIEVANPGNDCTSYRSGSFKVAIKRLFKIYTEEKEK